MASFRAGPADCVSCACWATEVPPSCSKDCRGRKELAPRPQRQRLRLRCCSEGGAATLTDGRRAVVRGGVDVRVVVQIEGCSHIPACILQKLLRLRLALEAWGQCRCCIR